MLERFRTDEYIESRAILIEGIRNVIITDGTDGAVFIIVFLVQHVVKMLIGIRYRVLSVKTPSLLGFRLELRQEAEDLPVSEVG